MWSRARLKSQTRICQESVEHLIVTNGQALAGPVDQPETLSPGDYLTYPADVSHIFEALEADTKAILVIENS